VDHTSSGNLGNSSYVLSINISIDEIVRSVCSNVKNSHPIRGVSLIIVHWLVPIHIFARRLAIINRIWLILRPDCVGIVLLVLKMSSASSLTYTIEWESVLGI
jgi:hypothetical protein